MLYILLIMFIVIPIYVLRSNKHKQKQINECIKLRHEILHKCTTWEQIVKEIVVSDPEGSDTIKKILTSIDYCRKMIEEYDKKPHWYIDLIVIDYILVDYVYTTILKYREESK